ncbi:MAG: hypothetical protein CVV07_07355 [Gammaproteobacteria bacterium HGW-Gammaproteobacteria-11]|nr:MAG: hypothetical protein CVV07_07355 [Gammaproteobacteria bacterium HGW-Gammaproteobacteria-11]
MKIKAIRNTTASGKDIVTGETYEAPQDLSLDDAKLLVRIGKALSLEEQAPAKTSTGGKGKGAAAKDKLPE